MKILGGTITTLGIIAGAVLSIDSRYVHADDLTQFKQEHARGIQQLGSDSQVQVNDLRRQMLEDKIFEIQLIPPNKRTDSDRARLDKYTRDINMIVGQNRMIRSQQQLK